MAPQLKRALIGGAAALSLALAGGHAITRIDGAPATIQNIAHLRAAPELAGLKLTKRKMIGGKKAHGTVTLTSAAPMGGVKVRLAAKSPRYIKVPKSVKVPAGKKLVRFPIRTARIARVGTGVVAAGLGGEVVKRRLTLTPRHYLTRLALDDYAVQGGTATGGTVALNKAAPAGGVRVTLASGNAKAQVKGQVKIPAGRKAAHFAILTQGVAADTEIKIAARYGQTLARGIVLTPGQAEVVHVPTKFTLHFDEFVDSSKARTLEAHIDINLPAPKGGLTLQVTSDQPGLLELAGGGRVTVPEGQTAAPFYIGFKQVAVVTPFRFTTTHNGVTVQSIVRNLAPGG
ncbi:hypothetical protein [Actinocorallia populi]|uniref:hypothetical protein n=1 Tax=Actinocorallia populi TaxID=2079200 RepID=UPI000D094E1D|nr:hypothetical protein [Actinocorallia populi]